MHTCCTNLLYKYYKRKKDQEYNKLILPNKGMYFIIYLTKALHPTPGEVFRSQYCGKQSVPEEWLLLQIEQTLNSSNNLVKTSRITKTLLNERHILWNRCCRCVPFLLHLSTIICQKNFCQIPSSLKSPLVSQQLTQYYRRC